MTFFVCASSILTQASDRNARLPFECVDFMSNAGQLEKMAAEDARPSNFQGRYSPNDLLLWYRATAARTRRFINVKNGESANLELPFASFFDDTKRTEFYGHGQWKPGMLPDHDSYHLIHWKWGANLAKPRAALYKNNTLGFIAIRSDLDGAKLSDREIAVQLPIPEERDHFLAGHTEVPAQAIDMTKKALGGLYQEYSGQGQGRSDELDNFQGEDFAKAQRTTHFVVHVNGKVVAHIQAQHSFDPAQPLNLEDHFGALDRKPGELVIELGRLFVAQYADLDPEIAEAIKSMGGRDYIRTLLFQKAFSWINNDAKCNRVVMQVNKRGRDHLMESRKRGFGQWQFDPLVRKVVDDPDRQEFVLSISGSNLLKTEDEEMLSLLNQDRKKAKDTNASSMFGWFDPSTRADTMAVFIRENEMPVISRLNEQRQLPDLIQRVDFPRVSEEHHYDNGVQRFNPQTSNLYFNIP